MGSISESIRKKGLHIPHTYHSTIGFEACKLLEPCNSFLRMPQNKPSIPSKQSITSKPQYQVHPDPASILQKPSWSRPVCIVSEVSDFHSIMPIYPFHSYQHSLNSLQGEESNVPNQRIDLDAIHIIQLLNRLLDLSLIRLDVADEDQCVVLLDLFHRTLRVQRVDQNFVGVQARLMWNRLAWIFGRAREDECLGPVEGRG